MYKRQIQHSVALLTEDRRATGIMGVLSVADNISIASLAVSYTHLGWKEGEKQQSFCSGS